MKYAHVQSISDTAISYRVGYIKLYIYIILYIYIHTYIYYTSKKSHPCVLKASSGGSAFAQVPTDAQTGRPSTGYLMISQFYGYLIGNIFINHGADWCVWLEIPRLWRTYAFLKTRLECVPSGNAKTEGKEWKDRKESGISITQGPPKNLQRGFWCWNMLEPWITWMHSSWPINTLCVCVSERFQEINVKWQCVKTLYPWWTSK